MPAVELAVTSSADDAKQSAAGVVTLDSTDLELVRDDGTDSGDQIIGLRFNGLPVPQGAIVTSATLRFTADESQSEATALRIGIEAADHAARFTEAANDLGARRLAPLAIEWTPPAWAAGQSGAAQLTPDLAGVIQQVLSRPGWVAGNAIAFLITGSGHRTARAFEPTGGGTARLSIEYRTPAPRYTVTCSVNSVGDDAEESASGAVTLDSSDLEIVNDDEAGAGDQAIGLQGARLPLRRRQPAIVPGGRKLERRSRS